MVSYADKYGLDYINFLKVKDEVGLDYNTDTYDAGLHLNLSGAEKMAVYFGKYLRDKCQVPDRRDDNELNNIWKQKEVLYNKEIEEQRIKYGVID